MTKILEQIIKKFDGGIANDLRDTDKAKFAVARHFDHLSLPGRLLPYRSYEAGNDTLGRKMTDFFYTSGKLFAMGVVSGTTKAAIYYKDTYTDGTWSTTANNESGVSAAPISGFFVHYKGFGYGICPNQSVFKYDITGVAAFVAQDLALSGTVTSVGGGLVHSKDDILYLAYNTAAGPIIAKKNGATWTDSALLLPTYLTITSICEYGNYLAIACKPTSVYGGNSSVYLWDRNSSVTTLAESIDWGSGELNVLEELEGRLIGISLEKRESSSNLLFNSVLHFKEYRGAQGAVEIARVDGSRDATITPLSSLGTQKQKINGRIYFACVLTTPEGSGSKEGIWSFGRSGSSQSFAVNVEYQTSDGTVPNAIDGFFIIGSYAFIAYSNSGTKSGNISKTNDAATFANNSTYESLIFDGGDASLKKKLIGVTVMTAPLPSGGQIVLKYAVDSSIATTTSFTTIFTHTTLNSLFHSAINIESSGATLPEWNELQLQIVSTGGAVITGFSFQYEITGKRLY